MSWLLLAIQLLLYTVLLLAATGKALRPEDFSAALRLSHLPARFVGSLSITIPAIEFGLALALVLTTPRTLPFALSATAVLFGIFTAWMIWIRANRLRVRCGCFGPGGAEVGQRTIARNGLLILLAAAGALLARRTESPLPGPSFWMVVTVTSLSLCLSLLAALRQAVPYFVLTYGQLQERRALAAGLSTEE